MHRPLNFDLNPANIYLFIISNKSTKKRLEICSKLTRKTSERQCCSGIFINFELITFHTSLLVFLLLTSSKQMLAKLMKTLTSSMNKSPLIFSIPCKQPLSTRYKFTSSQPAKITLRKLQQWLFHIYSMWTFHMLILLFYWVLGKLEKYSLLYFDVVFRGYRMEHWTKAG